MHACFACVYVSTTTAALADAPHRSIGSEESCPTVRGPQAAPAGLPCGYHTCDQCWRLCAVGARTRLPCGVACVWRPQPPPICHCGSGHHRAPTQSGSGEATLVSFTLHRRMVAASMAIRTTAFAMQQCGCRPLTLAGGHGVHSPAGSFCAGPPRQWLG